MHSTSTYCFTPTDRVWHTTAGPGHAMPLFVTLTSPDYKLRFEIQTDVDGMRRLRQAITDCLDAHDPARRVDPFTLPARPDGSTDRTDIIPLPAEAAVVDADELLETMASSYDVRRGPWEVGG